MTDNNSKIFVSIPCWRDPFLINTIQSAIDNAAFPSNLVFGVVFQGYEEDEWMIENLKSFNAEIRLIKINGNDTPIYLTKIKGDIACSLMQNEKYYMQVDSHTKFKKNWDIGLMAELHIATSKFGKVVLSPAVTYFEKWADEFTKFNYTAIPDEKHFQTLGDLFSFDKFPIAVYGMILDKPNNMMIHEKFYNGNCIFAYSDYVNDIPQPDNHTINYEQQIMALRIFTGGYKMMSTIHPYTMCFNYWTTNPEADEFVRNVRAKDDVWHEKFKEADLSSRSNYIKIMSEKIIDKKNGLLSEKSYEEYVDFIGYDPITLKLTRPAKMLEKDNFIFVSDDEFQEALSIFA